LVVAGIGKKRRRRNAEGEENSESFVHGRVNNGFTVHVNRGPSVLLSCIVFVMQAFPVTTPMISPSAQALSRLTHALSRMTQTHSLTAQTLSPMTQMLSVTTHSLSPVTQVFSPTTQVFSPATQTSSPMTQMLSPAMRAFRGDVEVMGAPGGSRSRAIG
jgi:hypothetical protein